MGPSDGRANVSARFNDSLFQADMARASPPGREALEAARVRIERDGLAASERRWCQPDHASGTNLPGWRRDVYELAHFRLHGSWPSRPA